MADVKISAVDIKQLWYFLPDKATGDLTGAMVKSIIEDATTVKIENVHQDTWTLEESESSQDEYKNQLTGMTYRMGSKTMGAIAANFTIGQYAYTDKKNLLGGEVITRTKSGGGTEVVGWKRARGIVEIKKGIIALTQDDQYCILPYCNLNARESNTDKAIGLAVVATAMEPKNVAIHPEYWFDKSEVDGGASET